jgi:hypothetical protein
MNMNRGVYIWQTKKNRPVAEVGLIQSYSGLIRSRGKDKETNRIHLSSLETEGTEM